MKIVAMALLVGLGGCAQLQQATNFATVGVANPITKTQLYEIENGATVAIAGLNAYKQTCISGAIPDTCKTTIRTIQVYTRQIATLLPTLRNFVRQNDQVNAPIVYNTITNLISQVKTLQGVQ